MIVPSWRMTERLLRLGDLLLRGVRGSGRGGRDGGTDANEGGRWVLMIRGRLEPHERGRGTVPCGGGRGVLEMLRGALVQWLLLLLGRWGRLELLRQRLRVGRRRVLLVLLSVVRGR